MSSRMGYDLDRFVGYVNEGLLCCVCRDVLERPLQAPCEHAYCSACISSWLIHHSSCPEDRLPLDAGSLKPLYRCVSMSTYMCTNTGSCRRFHLLKIQTSPCCYCSCLWWQVHAKRPDTPANTLCERSPGLRGGLFTGEPALSRGPVRVRLCSLH